MNLRITSAGLRRVAGIRSGLRKGFSLPEVLVTVGVIAVISTLAVSGYTYIRSESSERRAETTLVSVAGAQESYYQSRGTWATGDALSGLSRGDVLITEGASTGEEVVSVALLDISGRERLGLAVLSEEGHCITLLLDDPEVENESAVERRNLGGGETCTGSDAS